MRHKAPLSLRPRNMVDAVVGHVWYHVGLLETVTLLGIVPRKHSAAGHANAVTASGKRITLSRSCSLARCHETATVR